MNKKADTHVFVSYIREDTREVGALCSKLKSNGIEVWVDREKILPGERWQIAIRRAIEDGAFFIACFSESYHNRDSSYMNVELAIAVEQLACRPANRAWFIPVLLKGGVMPDRPIGGGETLRDIQWVDIGADWDGGLQQILKVLAPVPFSRSPTNTSRKLTAATVLVSDMVGSTTLSELLQPDELREILGEVARTLDSLVNEHGGQLVAMVGDGMMAKFKSPINAVECAMSIQSIVKKLGGDNIEIKLRIGLAEGPVLSNFSSAQDEVFGDVVNLAARICSLADEGQILISESVKRLTQNNRLRERGLVPLKGMAKPIRLFEVVL